MAAAAEGELQSGFRVGTGRGLDGRRSIVPAATISRARGAINRPVGQVAAHRKTRDGSQPHKSHEPGAQPQIEPLPYVSQDLDCANAGSLWVTNKAAAPVSAAARRSLKECVGFIVRFCLETG